jgi:BlaI family penicillinase repressor
MIGSYFGGSFERLVSFFAKDNDMDIHEMEELLKNVQQDINEQKDD